MKISASSHRNAANNGSHTRSRRSLSTPSSSATRGTSIQPHPARVDPSRSSGSGRADFAIAEPNNSCCPFWFNLRQSAGSPSFNDESLHLPCKCCTSTAFRRLADSEPQFGRITIRLASQGNVGTVDLADACLGSLSHCVFRFAILLKRGISTNPLRTPGTKASVMLSCS